jgi:uncharacterized repeat protein (TIGR03803 family)
VNRCALRILAVSLGLCAAAGNLVAQVTLTNLHSFAGGNDGSSPEAGLVQGSDGNFYGTTYAGGTNAGAGTVFRISPNASYTILYMFGSFIRDGGEPAAGLVQGRDGNFYGTTHNGGTNGVGTVFQITRDGDETILHSFTNNPDGSYPLAGLIQGKDGNFYGTTQQGGTNNDGIVFRITTNGSETILHSFSDNPDGAYPEDGLIQGDDGNFYGTTYNGGTNAFGTVFQITTNGNVTILHNFSDNPDGKNPQAGLIRANDGNFYGTTRYGGASGYGTVFRINPGGSYSNLYSFYGTSDGKFPEAGLIQGSDGNFYGTTSAGTNGGLGTVFRITTNGSESILYSFSGTDGSTPVAGLVQGSDGNFYGTTEVGGTNSPAYGTVFKLVVPLNPPANQISAIRTAGTNVLVTIPSVAYETYQLQFSSSMTPTNWVNQGGSVSNSIGAFLTVTNFGGALLPQGFYRFGITP